MKLKEISKPQTTASLNESLAKTFGQRINVDAFTLEQLQDARNKIRTELSQIETNESFDSVLKDSDYQKKKMFLDVLNSAVADRESISEDNGADEDNKMSTVNEKSAKPDYLDFDKDGDKKEPMKKALKDKKKKGPVKEGKNPTKAHVMKMVKDGKSEKEMMDMHSDADKDKLKAMIKDCKKEMKENKDQGKVIIENYFKSLIEGEEDKAEIVMAAKDMVDRITSWMEDTAEMQAESMLELGDAIRDELGASQSESYIQTVKPSLESLYAALEVTRGALTSGVAKLTGEEDPAQMMGDEAGAEPAVDADMEPSMDAEEPAAPADDFDASEPAAGGEDEAGRAKRESIELSLKLGQILSSKKK